MATAYQIKNELEALIYSAIRSIEESRIFLEEVLSATDEIRINENDEENEKDIDALSSGLNNAQNTLGDLRKQVNAIHWIDIPGMDLSDTDEGNDTQAHQEPSAHAAINGTKHNTGGINGNINSIINEGPTIEGMLRIMQEMMQTIREKDARIETLTEKLLEA